MSSPIWQGTTPAFNTAANWSTGSVPVSGDSAFLKLSSQDIAAYNASAIALALFSQDMSYTGLVGDASGYLQIGATLVSLGVPSAFGNGNGSRRMNLNLGSSAATINILGSAATGATLP